MIRNNLAMILAQKQIKISRMALDTGLSRTTLTSLSQNDSKRIDNDTLNVILMYLKITPNDFFEFLKYDFDIKLEAINFEFDFLEEQDITVITINKSEIDLFIIIDDKVSSRKPVYEFEITVSKLENKSVSETMYFIDEEGESKEETFSENIVFNISNKTSIEAFQSFADKEISRQFQQEISKKIKGDLQLFIYNKILSRHPKANQEYLHSVVNNIDLISSIEFLDFPSI